MTATENGALMVVATAIFSVRHHATWTSCQHTVAQLDHALVRIWLDIGRFPRPALGIFKKGKQQI